MSQSHFVIRLLVAAFSTPKGKLLSVNQHDGLLEIMREPSYGRVFGRWSIPAFMVGVITMTISWSMEKIDVLGGIACILWMVAAIYDLVAIIRNTTNTIKIIVSDRKIAIHHYPLLPDKVVFRAEAIDYVGSHRRGYLHWNFWGTTAAWRSTDGYNLSITYGGRESGGRAELHYVLLPYIDDEEVATGLRTLIETHLANGQS